MNFVMIDNNKMIRDIKFLFDENMKRVFDINFLNEKICVIKIEVVLLF